VETLSADMTRFDFHVNRFLDSEDVQRMSAEEVGQYILLLCEAWRLHKEATLPADPDYLSRVARVRKVSPRVMKKFFPVDMQTLDGKEVRLRNKRLFEEWQKAINRYQRFVIGGKNSAAKRSSFQAPSNHLQEDASNQGAAIPYHSIPYQSNGPASGLTDTEVEKILAKERAEVEQTLREAREKLARRGTENLEEE
jgi:uncharacterized protein YdaU (DUF1376 family)